MTEVAIVHDGVSPHFSFLMISGVHLEIVVSIITDLNPPVIQSVVFVFIEIAVLGLYTKCNEVLHTHEHVNGFDLSHFEGLLWVVKTEDLDIVDGCDL